MTFTRILFAKAQKLQIEWDVPFKDLQTISREKTGIQLIMRGGVQGPFIPISDTSSRDYLYKKISQAVHEINSVATGMAF